MPEGTELGYDDGEVDSSCSLGDWGHAVFFSNEGKLDIYGIKICGARFDDASRRFDIEIWDNNLKTLYSASYAYTDFFPDTYSPLEDSDLKWVTIDVPNIEVNANFYIVVFTYSGPPSWDKGAHDPHAPKGGIAIGRDSDTKSRNSFIVDKNPNSIVDWETITTWDIHQDDTDWMIRVVTAQGTSTSKTIYVDDDFAEDDPINHKWNTIKEGIEDADSGDTIIVKPGRYPEHLEVDKQVTLRGDEYPIIDGEGTGTVITIRADGIHIEGLNVIRCDPARENMEDGIRVSANNCVINNCIISDHNIGLGTGGKDNVISNCKFNDNRIGLVINNGERNTVKKNHFTKGGIILDNARNNLITNNIIELNSGISIYDKSEYNTIEDNTIQSNSMGAIEIVESEWGPTSHNNKIYHNNIIDNGYEFQAYDDGNNQWDNGAEGNYWGDYREKYPDARERDESGIWDTPYDYIGDFETNEKSCAKDNYPLMDLRSGGEEEKPDLTITDIWWDKENPKIGDDVTFSYTVKNQGTTDTPSDFGNRLFIDDESWGISARGSLGAGESKNRNFTHVWPATAGTHAIKVVADWEGCIGESDGTNNALTKDLEITNLEGGVLSADEGNGIADVTISLSPGGVSTKTSPNGYYSFKIVPEGHYTISASKTGYNFNQVTCYISNDATTTAPTITGNFDPTKVNAAISDPQYPSGSFVVGDRVSVNYTIQNTGSLEYTFYAGYSVITPWGEYWDAPCKAVTLGSGESTEVQLHWTVQDDAPLGGYNIVFAVWANQQLTYLYDRMDSRTTENFPFNIIEGERSISDWFLYNDDQRIVKVDRKEYTAIRAFSNEIGSSWLICNEEYEVESDPVIYKKAAETASMVSWMTPDGANDLRKMQDKIEFFTELSVLGQYVLWIRDTGSNLLGKYAVIAATGGSSLATQVPADKAVKEAAKEIAKDYATELKKKFEELPYSSLTETNIKKILWDTALNKLKSAAGKMDTAAEVIETHDEDSSWSYTEAHTYYTNYKESVINASGNMRLILELQPGADLKSQVKDITKNAIEGATSGIIDFDALLIDMSEREAVESAGIVMLKYDAMFNETEKEFNKSAELLQQAALGSDSISVKAECPVHLHAYDGPGNHVGLNAEGDVDLDIPGALYTGPDSDPENIIIFGVNTGINFAIEAFDEGEFDLTITQRSGPTKTEIAYENIQITQETVATVNVNEANPDYMMAIDNDGDGGVDSTIAPNSIETVQEEKETPGFEAIFAIAGLLVVAYFVLRSRRK